MPYTVKLLEEADKEYTEAAAWYEEQSAGLGTKFINVIQNKLNLIAQYPERYPKRKGNFRETPVKTFPYTIVYTIYKKEQIITCQRSFIRAEIQKENIESNESNDVVASYPKCSATLNSY